MFRFANIVCRFNSHSVYFLFVNKLARSSDIIETVRYSLRTDFCFVYVYFRDISKRVQPLIRHDCIAEIHLFTLRKTFNIERKSLSL